MTSEEILTQIQMTIVDTVLENCNNGYVAHGQAHYEAIEAYEQVAEYIDELVKQAWIDGSNANYKALRDSNMIKRR